MAEHLPDDILDKIMIGFDVKDLIRCKFVCKSWQSFISSSRFVKAQLAYSYNNDHNNNEFCHRRISIPMFGRAHKLLSRGVHEAFLGSSNGLVCISLSRAQVLVANPLTREVRKLPNPIFRDIIPSSRLCWGFGYDKSTDDYKVIIGYITCNDDYRRRFQVFSLKSNAWKVIGVVNYTQWTETIGTLCNGVLYWFMHDQNKREVIISFDLCREEFKEIPIPDDVPYALYDYTFDLTLGVFEECLCIYPPFRHNPRLLMKNYNGKESWELIPYVHEKDEDVVHYFQILEDYIPHTNFFIHDHIIKDKGWESIWYPIFVQSLVSPHLQEKNRPVQLIAKRMVRLVLINVYDTCFASLKELIVASNSLEGYLPHFMVLTLLSLQIISLITSHFPQIMGGP